MFAKPAYLTNIALYEALLAKGWVRLLGYFNLLDLQEEFDKRAEHIEIHAPEWYYMTPLELFHHTAIHMEELFWGSPISRMRHYCHVI